MTTETLLLVHELAETYVARVRAAVPNWTVLTASNERSLQTALEKHRPTVAFSCVSQGFPRHLHRPVIDIETLRWLQVGGSGFDHFEGWRDRQLTLTNAAGVLAPYLADSIVTMIRAFCFRLPERIAAQREHAWKPLEFRDIAGQKLLVVGTGAIAQQVALKASCIGMDVTGFSRSPRTIEGFARIIGRDQLDAWLPKADFVSLHVPLDDASRHLFNAERLSLMHKDAFLLNASRGPVVDEKALVECLAERRIAGAYLDVFETEPLPPTSPLWDLSNAVISAHCSDAVENWPIKLADFFIENLERYRDGKPLEKVIQR